MLPGNPYFLFGKKRISVEKILGFDNDILIKDLFEIMTEVLANRDLTTFKHTKRVASIARQIGVAMKLPEKELKILELGCLVHDIGKTAIPDDVLLKPGLFSDQDRRLMEYHPLIGAKLFARRMNDDRITHIILRHHERLDGSGYPFGLKGDEIDLLSRITAVADVFEAMTAKRPYKIRISTENALMVLKQEAVENHLDAHIVGVLDSIKDSLEFEETVLYPTAEFMEEIEQFRRDTFFRDTLSELYSYRYLLVLDDLKLLCEQNTSGYLLSLISFKQLGRFQLNQGVILASQVHDEIGHRLKDTVAQFSQKRKHYDGSIMLFRKHCDYMIYAEADREEDLSPFRNKLRKMLELIHEEWDLEPNCFRIWFNKDVSMESAMEQVFSLKEKQAEACTQ